MRLNIINNFRAIYYNTLANFYLYFNTFVPYYDDVILSLSITSFKNILRNNQISLKSIKEGRLMQLLSTLDDKDRIIVDDDGFIFIDYHPKDDEEQEQEVKETLDDETSRETTVVDTVEDTEGTTVEDTVEEPVADTEEATVADTEEATVADTVETTVEEPVADTEDTTEDTTVEEPVADTEDTTVEEPVADTLDTECYNSLEKKNN